MVQQMAAMPEKILRNVGLGLIFAGLVLLLLVRG